MTVRKLVFSLMIVFVAAIAVGCSSGTEATQKALQEKNAVSEDQKVALPEERAAFIGKVKDIVGNEVTVLIGELPQNQGTPAERSAKQNQNQENQGVRPQNRGFGFTFTEETETFLIPVGVPIVTLQRGTGEVTQVGLTEIKKDTILLLWKNEDTISFVQVTGANMQRVTGQGADGNRQGAGAGAGGGFPPGMGGSPPAMGGNR